MSHPLYDLLLRLEDAKIPFPLSRNWSDVTVHGAEPRRGGRRRKTDLDSNRRVESKQGHDDPAHRGMADSANA